MKTIVSVLGTVLLIGAVAFAQTSASGSKAKKSSTDSTQLSSTTSSGSDRSTSPSSNTSVKAGNSGFDEDSTTASAQSSSSSSPSAAQSGSSYSTSGQSGSNAAQSISNGPVAETVSDSSAVIGWSTSSPSNSTSVKYGGNRANMTQTAQGTDGSDGKNHHAKLDGLSPSTRYYFQVMENGQPVGGVGTFKTTAAGEQPVQSKAVIPQK